MLRACVCMLRACACMLTRACFVHVCACFVHVRAWFVHVHACFVHMRAEMSTHELHPHTSCVDIWCNRASTTNREWRALIGTEVGLTDDKDGEEDSGGYREGDSYGGEDELQGSVCHECHQQFHLQYYDFHLSLYRELESPFTIIIVLPNQQKSTSKVVIEHT